MPAHLDGFVDNSLPIRWTILRLTAQGKNNPELKARRSLFGQRRRFVEKFFFRFPFTSPSQ